MADIKKEYERWLANATIDADVAAELKTLDDTKIEDAFYRDLAFGTGGLRGVIGAGTNRMNIYTVAKASQGLADYLKKNFEMPSVAIGYDSRILLLRSAPTYVHFFGVIKFKLVDTLPAPAAEKLVFDDPFAARTRCVCSLVFIDVNLVNAHRPAVGRG